ncbi:protein arginine kinase [Halonatronum saccharophilum]|uniref:protein arginine kinase n=1 Tax=Halonatronum saccharophilum TaxID=150060 RepID=UPI0004BBDA35|nr:protein arginine kinase [Halonatronum saccharophilum]
MSDILNYGWSLEELEENEVVISSRIRLARNLKDYKFTNYASDEELSELADDIKGIFKNTEKLKLSLIYLNQLNDIDRRVLVEKHLISPEHAKKDKNRLVVLSKEETISIMVNEEDHLRIQVLFPGLNLLKAFKIADDIDDYIEGHFDIAFDEKYGYLTSCPTNVGTGLRASIMVHLPALNMLSRVKKLMSTISQLGLAVRGLYGEGTDVIGNIYQISNQVTLGQSEDEIIDSLLEVTKQIINQERNARRLLLEEKKVLLKDKVYRSYGILKYAYKVAIKESMKLISNVKLGVDLGIINDIDSSILNELMITVRSANLEKKNGDRLSLEEKDIYRAQLIQERLK